MVKLIIFVFIIILSVLLGLYLKQDPGYVLIIYNNYSIELSFWLTVFLLVSTFLLLYNFIHIFKAIYNIPSNIKNLRKNRTKQRELSQVSHALLKIAEGEYRQAENLLNRRTSTRKRDLIKYLIAAKAAQEQKATTKRDRYLKLAHESSPNSTLSIGLMQVNLQIANHEYESALAILCNLRETYYSNKLLLKYLYIVYYNLSDWESIMALSSDLSRYGVFSKKELLEKEILVANNLFKQSINNTSEDKSYSKTEAVSKIKAIYDNLSKAAKQSLHLTVLFINSIIGLDYSNKKYYINLLDNVLKYNLHDHHSWYNSSVSSDINSDANKLEALNLFVQLADCEQELLLLEKHLKNDNYNINLLFSLGRLAIKLECYDKAYQYLNQSKKLINSKNKSLPIDNYLAFVLLKQGKDKLSLDLFENYFKTCQQV